MSRKSQYLGNPSVTSGKRPPEHVTQGPAAGALIHQP